MVAKLCTIRVVNLVWGNTVTKADNQDKVSTVTKADNQDKVSMVTKVDNQDKVSMVIRVVNTVIKAGNLVHTVTKAHKITPTIIPIISTITISIRTLPIIQNSITATGTMITMVIVIIMAIGTIIGAALLGNGGAATMVFGCGTVALMYLSTKTNPAYAAIGMA